MTGSDINLDQLRDEAHALVGVDEPRPAWLWAGDGSSLLWANEAGLDALGVSDLATAEVTPSTPARRSLQAVGRMHVGNAGRGRIEILRVSARSHQETLVATCRPVELAGTRVILSLGNRPQPAFTGGRGVDDANPNPIELGDRHADDDQPTLEGNSPAVTALAANVATSSETSSTADPSATFDLDIASADALGSAQVSAEETASGTTDDAGALAAEDGFVFTPRSRPHRFSFLVSPAGRITGVSSGLADAVGPTTALGDGEEAANALRTRLTSLPDDVASAIEQRTRFSTHTVSWPVSGHAIDVPVRLSGFEEDGGALRVFGTALTNQAVAAAAADSSAITPADPVSDTGHQPQGEDGPPSPSTASPTPEGSADDTGPADVLPPDTSQASEPVDRPEVTEPTVETASPVPGTAALARAATSLAAGLAGAMSATGSAHDAEPALDSETDEHGLTIRPGHKDGPGDGAASVAAADSDEDAEPHEDRVSDLEPQATGEPAADSQLHASTIEADNQDVIEDDLSRPERLTFQEIARRLGARISNQDDNQASSAQDAPSGQSDPGPDLDSADPEEAEISQRETERVSGDADVLPFAPRGTNAERQILDRLPLGVIIYTDDSITYANRAAMDMAGMTSLQSLKALDGIEDLFAEGLNDGNGAMTLVRPNGSHLPVTGRLQSVHWEGQPAALLSIREYLAFDAANDEARADASLSAEDPQGGDGANTPIDGGAMPLVRARIGELEAIIDLASDGVVTLSESGEIRDLNQAAQALVGYAGNDLQGRHFRLLFPEDSRQIAQDYFDDMARQGRLSLFNEGRELECITSQGGLVPVFMTLGRLTDDEPATYCAVLRDLSPFKQAETDLVEARRAAEQASAHKSDFLARVSHEIRTPLNAVIGFSEVMLEERFGPVGSERYRQYLRDIHTSGEHLMGLLNDLLDLSKIEAGKMDLTFAEVDLNDVVEQCLTIMQPQANQGGVIVRTSLPVTLPKVVADIRSVRQAVLNLMSNAIKFTEQGGQIIVSTLYEPSGEVSLRVRDTGRGMDQAEVDLALEPFRQVPTTLNQAISGTGLGLPLTKALVQANRAQFGLESTLGEGTLAIVTFPPQRVLAE